MQFNKFLLHGRQICHKRDKRVFPENSSLRYGRISFGKNNLCANHRAKKTIAGKKNAMYSRIPCRASWYLEKSHFPMIHFIQTSTIPFSQLLKSPTSQTNSPGGSRRFGALNCKTVHDSRLQPPKCLMPGFS